VRDIWWWLLDVFEAHRAARVALYLTAGAIVFGGTAWYWVYPWWTKRTAIRIAQQWLDSGHLRYAAEAAQHAALVNPDSPVPWQIAAELARRGGQLDKALDYSRRAAELAPDDPQAHIAWAAAALRAEQLAETDRALDKLPIEMQAQSPDVQRLRGEMARRQMRLTAAKGYFEAALRLEGPRAVNEVPLGLILLNAAETTGRKHGQDLLKKWTSDREWGATALRTLLADALVREDKAGMLRWAEELRNHPRCLVADMPQCLLAMAKADESRYAEVLAKLEQDHAVNPQAAAQLLNWLNEIGRPADAVRWMHTLPAPDLGRPPLAILAAEALRAEGDWPELKAWTDGKNWGTDSEFLRWAYALQAAKMLGDKARAEELWHTLRSDAQLNGVHALFAASLIYSWGRVVEAEALWWIAAGQEGKIAIDALGSLARHYQVHRDAEGQYQVFRQLHLLQPSNAEAGNNFAFFAILTGREQRVADQVARANLASEPHNRVYVATYGFVLYMQQKADEALALLKPMAIEAGQSPPLAFAYGMALAGTGQKQAARKLLEALPPETLTLREVELIKSALAD
jgi:Flp pilus assembly protein TadD